MSRSVSSVRFRSVMSRATVCMNGSPAISIRRMLNSDYGLVLKGINDNDRSVINAGINIMTASHSGK